jgi:hypothetical protein
MGLIDEQLETLATTIQGSEIKRSIVEALDILDKNLPIVKREDGGNG